jgi:site-specific recombinase XerD
LRKIPERVASFMSVEDALYFLEKAKDNREHFAMMMVYLNTGIRQSELINLNKSDLRDSKIRITGKGNKERLIDVNDGVIKAINDYYDTRKDNLPYMFVSNNGTRYSPSGINIIVKEIAKKAYCDDIHTHSLRHTFSNMVIELGYGIYDLQQVLGHNSVQITEQYLHGIPAARSKEIAQRSAFNIG